MLARNKRLAEIEQSLNALGRQLETKAGIVGGKVLLNPYSSPHAIANIESITSDLNAFASTLQLEHIHLHVEDGPTWIEAAGKAVDDTGKALQNARQQTAHVGLFHLIIINTCHKQANKHFGEGYSCDVALYH